MSSQDKQIVDEIVKLGVPKSKAENIVKNMSAVEKTMALKDVAFLQDICQTPALPGPIPIPDHAIGKFADMSNGSKKVKIDGKEDRIGEKSSYEQSSGDEPGSTKLGKISVIDGEQLRKIKDQAKKVFDKIKDESKNLLHCVGDMNPNGYKLLAITLIIGLTGGFYVGSINCSRRIRILRNEMELGGPFQENGLEFEQGGRPYGTDVFGGFEISGVIWDIEAQEVSVNVSNTGSMMVILFSLAVHRFEETDVLYSVHIHEPYGSLASGSSRMHIWAASVVEAPPGYLEPGRRYRVSVTSHTGFTTVWIEAISNQ